MARKKQEASRLMIRSRKKRLCARRVMVREMYPKPRASRRRRGSLTSLQWQLIFFRSGAPEK
jgi:hypothetical protein